MNNSKQKLIADTVKKQRMLLGYTQKEVSEMSNISLRSVQRIERGEVMPRMHTLNLLADSLDFSIESIQIRKRNPEGGVRVYKITLSISSVVLPLLLFGAYMAQSSTFPETDFEFLLSCFIILSLISIFLLRIWSPTSEYQL